MDQLDGSPTDTDDRAGSCGFTGTAEQEFFPWPAAPPCPAGLVLVFLATSTVGPFSNFGMF